MNPETQATSPVPASPDGRPGKKLARLLAATITIVALGGTLELATSCRLAPARSQKQSLAGVQLRAFVAEKAAQAQLAATKEGKEMVPEFKPFFAMAAEGNWLVVSNLFEQFRRCAPQFQGDQPPDWRMVGPQWHAVLEVWGAFVAFVEGDEKYPLIFGTNIIASIPPGSIYFAGSDPGRFVITALQKSHVRGEPFFTLSPNALVDGSYLDYAHGMYAASIYTPSPEDAQNCFRDYLTNAARRLEHDLRFPDEPKQIQPCEQVIPVTQDGQTRIQVSGQVAVMNINALLVKVIFDRNPDREFFIEGSFPLDWMYPHLEPHGLIRKINRQALPRLSEEVVAKDREYWKQFVKPLIGDWLTEETTVQQVTTFAEQIWLQRDFRNFKGDRRFIEDDYSRAWLSNLRCSIADVYAWRANQATSIAEKERMMQEADFAFLQALAFWPCSPTTIYRYVQLLLVMDRVPEAVLIAETAAEIPLQLESDRVQIRNLAEQLKKYQKPK